MRKIKIMIILFLLFGFASVYAQQTSKETDKAVTQSSNEMIDPKLSPEEQLQIQIAGQDNPAKIDESQMVDSKIDPATLPTEEDFGPSNAKPEPAEEREMVLAPQVKSSKANSVNKKDVAQPKGETPENVVNYRNMNGSKDQPKGEEPVNVINYRDVKGSKSQPMPNDPQLEKVNAKEKDNE